MKTNREDQISTINIHYFSFQHFFVIEKNSADKKSAKDKKKCWTKLKIDKWSEICTLHNVNIPNRYIIPSLFSILYVSSTWLVHNPFIILQSFHFQINIDAWFKTHIFIIEVLSKSSKVCTFCQLMIEIVLLLVPWKIVLHHLFFLDYLLNVRNSFSPCHSGYEMKKINFLFSRIKGEILFIQITDTSKNYFYIQFHYFFLCM